MKKYVAEAVGAFLLALAVALSLAGKFPVPTAVVAGLTLGACVYTLGAISGAHVNPAITIGLLAIRRIGVKDAAGYVVAQFVGAVLAMLVARAMLPAPAALAVVDSAAVFSSEALGTFVLALGVASVVHGKAGADASGLVIGGSLLIGISLAVTSNGVLNPAVAVAIGSASATYLIAPIVGALIAMFLYSFIEQ